MKKLKEVEETRKKYHKDPLLNSVHRSSLMVPELDDSIAEISFLNHFLIKRNHKKIINLASGKSYSIIELAKLVVNNKYFKKTNIPIYFSNGTKYLKSKNHPIVNKKFKIDTSNLRKLGFKNNQKIEVGIFDLLKKI